MPHAPDVSDVAGSFRDPAGRMFERGGTLYRSVAARFAADYTALVESGLYDALVSEHLLVPHEEVDPAVAPAGEDAWRVLQPERLAFVSYPYEWCTGQLRAAALATLRIQEVALAHDCTLRDASAYNIQFRDGRPLLIDTLSLGRLEPEAPWVAYGQFCRHFLAPLALADHVDTRLLTLLASHLDGIPLDLAASMLPGRTWLRAGLVQHLHLHARAGRTREAAVGAPRRDARFSLKALRGLVESLRAAVAKPASSSSATHWSRYYAAADHYDESAMAAKERLVADHLAVLAPGTVCDLGANTGRFSRLAAHEARLVVAADADHGAVEAAWQEVCGDEPPGDGSRGEILPLRIDVTAPSPAVGWANRERDGFTRRGPFDVVLALALVHHLAIGNNVPLAAIASYLAELGHHVIIEFVPRSDPKVEVLLATREDIFETYTQDAFDDAMGAEFEIVDRAPVGGSGRILYLLRARGRVSEAG